jgi:subtilisin family serine protease
MRKIRLFVLSILSLFVLSSQLKGMPLVSVEANALSETFISEDAEYVSDRIIIKLEETTGGFSFFSFLSSDYFDPSDFNIESLEKISMVNEEQPQSGFFSMFNSSTTQTWYSAKLSDSTSVEAAIEALKDHPKVKVVEPDYIYKTAQVGLPDETTDPNINQQWYLGNINAPQAWEHLQSLDLPYGGSRDVIVAVIDTGVDYNHVDLNANMWINSREIPGNGIDDDGNGIVDDYYGYNAVFENGNPMDDHGHGTHVAGIIGMVSNNQLGGVGVASNVQLMAIKAANASGFLTASNIAKAINYAVTHGADVINMSFGSTAQSTIVKEALVMAHPQSILVAATGNEGAGNEYNPNNLRCLLNIKPIYPAAYDWVIGVMAHDSNNKLASFSNFDCISMSAIEYEISAPGVGIYSSIPNNRFASWSGTSMAAPMVSAIAALVKTRFNEMPNIFIASQVKDSVSGRIDAYKSITEIVQPVISLSEYYFFDNLDLSAENNQDGVIDAGETFDIGLVLLNRKGSARDVRVEIVNNNDESIAYDTQLEVLIPEAVFENIGILSKSDNIYYENNVAKSVRIPLRVKVKSNTPNDYGIRLNFNVYAKDAYFENEVKSSFHLDFYVRSGVVLPQIINEDMTLTKDKLWIIDKPTLVDENTTVTVEPGTTVQFYSSDSNYVYSRGNKPYLMIFGNWISHGTSDEMIHYTISESFINDPTSAILMSSSIRKMDDQHLLDTYKYFNPLGYSSFRYSEIINPRIAVNSIEYSKIVRQSNYVMPQIIADSMTDSIYSIGGEYKIWFKNLERNVILKNEIAKNTEFIFTGVNNLSIKSQPKLRESFRIYDDYFYQFFEPYLYEDFFYSLMHFRQGTWSIVNSREIFDEIASNVEGEFLRFQSIEELNYILDYSKYLYDNYESFIKKYHKGYEYENESFMISQIRSLHYIGKVLIRNNRISSWCDGSDFEIENFQSLITTDVNILSGYDSKCVGLYINPASKKLELSYQNEIYPNSNTVALLKIPFENISLISDSNVKENLKNFMIQKSREISGGNVVLNPWFDLTTKSWTTMRTNSTSSMLIASKTVDHYSAYIFSEPYDLLQYAIYDYYDDPTYSVLQYYTDQDYPEEVWPFVTDVRFTDKDGIERNEFGIEDVIATVKFNRDMNTSIDPTVQFGGVYPFSSANFVGEWLNSRTWVGAFKVKPYIFDGYQYMSVFGAVADDDQWKISQIDSERFRFKVNSSITNSTFLQASGEENQVRLQWVQDDFDLLAGYNIYRSNAVSGQFTKINTTIIPDFQKEYVDTQVNPGETYYYAFSVVQTDFAESQLSNIASATPIDNIPPVITHTPITSANPNQSLTISATITDNISVQSATLYYKSILSPAWSSKSMNHAGNNVYRASIEASVMSAPGVLYYIQASDGVSIARIGSASVPHTISISEAPLVTSVTPSTGNTQGGDTVDIIGTNFKSGASVLFNNSPASEVTWISSTRLRVKTPQHAPSMVDVKVTNPDGYFSVLPKAFTYVSTGSEISLPSIEGYVGQIIQVPVYLASVNSLMSLELEINYDASVLELLSVRNGALTSSFASAHNTQTPGLIRSALASSSNVSGDGSVLMLEFLVVGEENESSYPITIESVSLNDGAIALTVIEGVFRYATRYVLSGNVHYYSNSNTVPGVNVKIIGNRLIEGISDEQGQYMLSGIELGEYSYELNKTDHVKAISAMDASYALMYSVGLINLNSYQRLAGDVNMSGSITAMDASYILQRAAGLLTGVYPGSQKVWHFISPHQQPFLINQNTVHSNIIAILLGDISGNWSVDFE